MLPRVGVACHFCRSSPPMDDMQESFTDAIDVAVSRWRFRQDSHGNVWCARCVDQHEPDNLLPT